MTQLSRHLTSLIETPSSDLPKGMKKRKKWFSSVFEVVNFLKDLRSSGDENQIWAAATHLIDNPEENSYLNPLGIKRRPNELSELLMRCSSNGVKIHPEGENDHTPKFTFIDLFAGIGGFNLALSRAGGKCLFASEWDDSARITYAMNFGKIPFGDIREFTRRNGEPLRPAEVRRNVPKSDVIAAGFPCQPFSQAGVASRNFHGLSHGLECEAQGTLFEDILIIARATKPKILLLENVSNLARHDGGRTLQVIINEIKSSGYTIFPERKKSSDSNWAVIDSQSVVAQRRKRIYLVCIRNDLAKLKGCPTFPEFKLPEKPFPLSEILKKDNTLSDFEKFEEFSISNKLWLSHKARDARHKARGNGFRMGLVDDLSQPAPTLVARYYKDGKDCLIPNSVNPSKPPRTLTPRECALLQTFPKSFWIPNSKTPAFKQLGNSITVEIASQIAMSVSNHYFS